MSKPTWTFNVSFPVKILTIVCILGVLFSMCLQEEVVYHTGTIVEKQIVYNRASSENDYVSVVVCDDGYVRTVHELSVYAKPLNSRVTWSETNIVFKDFFN